MIDDLTDLSSEPSMPCDVCAAEMSPIGYGDGSCPRCGSRYRYDESAFLDLDEGQLWAVKVFTLARQRTRRLFQPVALTVKHLRIASRPEGESSTDCEEGCGCRWDPTSPTYHQK